MLKRFCYVVMISVDRWVVFFVGQPPNVIPGVGPGVLIEALTTVYGLADAPLAWYNSFTKALQGLGCRQSRMDNCLYYAYSRHDPHELIGAIALHVDDMCLGGNEEFETRVLTPFNSKYPFKHWRKFKGMLRGKQLEQQSNYDIHVQQTEYAQTIQGIKLSMERKKQRYENTYDDEKKQMRVVLGAINWFVTGSRPDLAAACSLLRQRVMSSVVSDLLDVNRLVPQVPDPSEQTIKIKSVPTKNVCFIVIFDAAWPNAPGLFSQAGFMILPWIRESWKTRGGNSPCYGGRISNRTDEHHPLRAELIALSRSLAAGRWMRSMWLRAIYHE